MRNNEDVDRECKYCYGSNPKEDIEGTAKLYKIIWHDEVQSAEGIIRVVDRIIEVGSQSFDLPEICNGQREEDYAEASNHTANNIVPFLAAGLDVEEAQAKIHEAEEDEDMSDVFDQAAYVEEAGLDLI